MSFSRESSSSRRGLTFDDDQQQQQPVTTTSHEHQSNVSFLHQSTTSRLLAPETQPCPNTITNTNLNMTPHKTPHNKTLFGAVMEKWTPATPSTSIRNYLDAMSPFQLLTPNNNNNSSISANNKSPDVVTKHQRHEWQECRELPMDWTLLSEWQLIAEPGLAWNVTQPPPLEYYSASNNWQQALRDLALKWIQTPSTYFYCIIAGQHVVLFRYNQQQQQPQVLLVSSPVEWRNALQSLEVTLTLAAPWKGRDTGTVWDEQVLLEQDATAKPTASPATQAELVALRRAQVTRQHVGAEVEVHTGTTATTTNSALLSIVRTTVPPLVVTGREDCWALVQLALNKWNTNGQLIAPHAFANAVPKRLSWSRQRDREGRTVTLTVHGDVILPNLRQQLCEWAVQHRGETEQLVMHHVPYRTSVEPTTTTGRFVGNSDTSRLNDDNDPVQYREYINMVVWDSSRPTALTYKVEKESA